MYSFPFLDSLFKKPKVIDIDHERRNISNLAIGVASITFFTLLAQIVLINVLAIFAPALTASYLALMFVNAVTMYGIAMPLSMIYFNRCEAHPVEKRKMDAGTLIGVIFLCFALMYVGSIVGNWIEELTSSLMGKAATNPVADTVSEIPLWAIFLFMVILAPIFEEIFFRRVVINRLRRYGDGPAIVVSGVIFGVIHGNFSQFFYAALLGMVFAAIYLHTGNLKITIFLHMVINFMGSFYTSVMMEKFGGEIPAEFTEEIIEMYPTGYTMMSAYSMLYTASLIFAIPVLIRLIREFRRSPAEVSLKGSQRFKAVFCNLGFWFATLFLLGNFALSIIPI